MKDGSMVPLEISSGKRVMGEWFKRAFDLLAAVTALLLLLPLFGLIALLIKADSRGNVLFVQERVGREFRPFRIFKFRSMTADAPARGGMITSSGDPRVTRAGKLLRLTKLDELPQLWNILRGDMSFVGPRPEVPRYVNAFKEEYKEILSVRPGLTDLASLKYRDESAFLAQFEDTEQAYLNVILPDKIALARQYISRSSLPYDLKLILLTLRSVFYPKSPEVSHSADRSLSMSRKV